MCIKCGAADESDNGRTEKNPVAKRKKLKEKELKNDNGDDGVKFRGVILVLAFFRGKKKGRQIRILFLDLKTRAEDFSSSSFFTLFHDICAVLVFAPRRPDFFWPSNH